MRILDVYKHSVHAFCVLALLLYTSKVVTMSFVHMSAVVLPPMLLQMVNELDLVKCMDSQ